jgi:nitronate monooxygenase/enoyl-[acyl-carrier protein] reductase II
MLHTQLCDLFEIEFPIIQAAIAPFTSAELVAAVSNAGGLGSLGVAMTPLDEFKRRLAKTQELTRRPFVINHALSLFSEETFQLTLQARPAAISFANRDAGDLVKRVHEAGLKVIQQVHTVTQARQAAANGVDLIIAQGSEGGGFSGEVGALTLIPQVVDTVHPIPVVAAGGIADGRGLAAALTLGAVGVNIGTRFLASKEAIISEEWKQAIVAAESEEAIKADVINEIFPRPPGNYDVAPRSLRTAFLDEWQQRKDEARREAERLRGDIVTAIQTGRLYEYAPFTGQTAGAIHDILPAAEIVQRLVTEAEEVLRRTHRAFKVA